VFKFLFSGVRVLRLVLASFLMCFVLVDVSYAANTYKLPSGEVLNDPTRPHNWSRGSSPKAKAKHFTLNYILKTAQRTKAIINGKSVTEGDSVSGAKVIRIKQNTVMILVDGKRKTLHLNKNGRVRKMKH